MEKLTHLMTLFAAPVIFMVPLSVTIEAVELTPPWGSSPPRSASATGRKLKAPAISPAQTAAVSRFQPLPSIAAARLSFRGGAEEAAKIPSKFLSVAISPFLSLFRQFFLFFA